MSRIALVLLFVLVPAGVAHAGGWAAVAVDRIPDDTEAGQPVKVQLVVLQHGRTPMDGLKPSIKISNDAGVVRTFDARPTGKPGTYVSSVTFPANGRWRWQIFDGFTDAVPHIPPPVQIGPGTASPSAAPATVSAPAGGFPWPQTIAIALVALAFAFGFVLTRPKPPARDRRAASGPSPAPGAMA